MLGKVETDLPAVCEWRVPGKQIPFSGNLARVVVEAYGTHRYEIRRDVRR